MMMMSAIVADRPRHAFPLKSVFVGVVVTVGKVEQTKFNSSDHSDRVSQTVPDNFLSVPICRGHDADCVADRVADRRRSLQIIWESGLIHVFMSF